MRSKGLEGCALPLGTSAGLPARMGLAATRAATRRDTTRASENPATRTFQALRVAVNDELAVLDRLLQQAPDWLQPDGLLAIISFHSLEDRRVKTAFLSDERLQRVTRKPLRADEAEQQLNPRSRSAKLRIARRRPSEPSPSEPRSEA